MPTQTRTEIYTFRHVPELPDTPEPGVVYLEGQNQRPYCAAFLCPCGCSAFVQLNLVQGSRPCWQVSGDTISPSVNREHRCKAHFFIKGGRVQWA